MNKATQSRFYIYVIILILASVIRINYIINNPVHVRDTFEYRDFLENEGNKNFYEKHVHPPLAMYIIRLPSKITNCDTIKGGCVINNLLGLMIVLSTMLITNEFTKSKLYIIFAGLLAATHESLVEFSCEMLRENSYLLFSSIGILCLIKAIKNESSINHILCGICFALAGLCRYEAFEFIIVFLIVTALFEKRFRTMMKSSMCFATGYLSAFLIAYLVIDERKEYSLLYLNKIYDTFF